MVTIEKCDCQHEDTFRAMELAREDWRTDLRDLWQAIEKKCPMSLFLFLVALMLSNLAFQWSIYSNLQELDKKIVVIETRLSDNAKSCQPK